MPDNSLPDEIISEILSPALKVDDDAFSDNTSEVSPFLTYSESPSAYLLVCKSWLRVATPLLYNVVVLRSKAQAKVLSRALSENKDLGLLIRKLRVEGGYGLPMHTILKSAPNITDIYLSLEIFSPDSTDGLCSGLKLISPTRLILRDHCWRAIKNKMACNFINALVDVIPKWDRLTVFDTVIVDGAFNATWARDTFKECPLQTIQIKKPVEPRYLNEEGKKLHPAQPSGRLEDLCPIPPTLNPFFVPMKEVPEMIQEKVWTRVLYFAMSVPQRAVVPSRKDYPPRFPLLLVSKTFFKLGLPYYYRHVVLTEDQNLASVLSDRPSLGACIHTISGWESKHHPEHVDDMSDSEDDSDADRHGSKILAGDIVRMAVSENAPGEASPHPMLTILSRTSRLRKLLLLPFHPKSSTMMLYLDIGVSWEVFTAMAQCCGSSLRTCSVRIFELRSRSASLDVFTHFRTLRKLSWCCDLELEQGGQSNENTLSELKQLLLRRLSKSFLTVLASLKLPSLKCIAMFVNIPSESFLQVHGPKLSKLEMPIQAVRAQQANILDLCPNLNSLTLSWKSVCFGMEENKASLNEKDLRPCTSVASLRELKFDVHNIGERSRAVQAKWEDSFKNFPHESIPNLARVQITGLEWPKSEREIAKSS